MKNKGFILFLALAGSAAGFGAGGSGQVLLRDGFVLKGVEGRVSGRQGNEAARSPYTGLAGRELWFFEPFTDVNDQRVVVKAGTRFEILPSAALERMIGDIGELPSAGYVLWARVTRYKGRNFIAPYYLLRIAESEPPEPQPTREPEEPNDVRPEGEGPADANEMLGIPKEILEQINERKKRQGKKIVKPLETVTPAAGDANAPLSEEKTRGTVQELKMKRDSMLVDRTAVLVELDQGRFSFMFDALGRSVGTRSFQILPCEALELTESSQAAVPEPVRFRIAGIVTRFKGKDYLLLQRAARVYSYGNFRSPVIYE